MENGVKGRLSMESDRAWWWEPQEETLPFDFCRDTSLHGLKYIYQPNRHLSERIFWLISFIVALTVAVYLISGVWKNYRDKPIIVAFEPFETTVDEIPFPAVTICNMNKVQKTHVNKILEGLKADDTSPEYEDATKQVFLLHHICNVSSGFSKTFNFSLDQGAVEDSILESLPTTNETDSGQLDIEKFLQNASQKCPDMLPLCIWSDEIKNCTKLFNPIETDFGKCCTFNMVSQSLLHKFRNDSRDDPEEVRQWSNWNLDTDGLLITKDHDENGIFREFPRRQKRAGKSFGLSILLDPDLEEYFCTTSDSIGFRLSTHLSIDVPHVADFGIAIMPNSEVFVNVKPEITMAEETIKEFPLNKRRCYFPNDQSLTYYNYYTPSNCIDECLAEATFQACNCVRYYMPRTGDDNRSLCGPEKFGCAEGVKKKYILQGLKSDCRQCLRTCTEIQYLMETTTTPLLYNETNWMYENGSFAKWKHNNVSIVHIFIGQPSTYARVRKQLYGGTDLMANTGGLMGLCLGFSGLSLVELIYFFTLRAWWRKKRSDNFGSKIFHSVLNTWMSKTKGVSGFLSSNDHSSNVGKRKNDSCLDPAVTLPSVSSTSASHQSFISRSLNFGRMRNSNQNNNNNSNSVSNNNNSQSSLIREINSPFLMDSSNYPPNLQLTSDTRNKSSHHGNVENPNAKALFNEIAPYYNNNNRTQYWEF